MAKRIMHALKMREISAVDRPAQAHAKSVIMKRAPDGAADVLKWLSPGTYEGDLAPCVAHFAKRDFSAKEREKDAKSGAAMKDGSFPIENETDLRNAERLAGHAKDPAAARAHIRARAKALGLSTHMSKSETEKEIMEAILKALGLAAGATEADVIAAIAKMASAGKEDVTKLQAELEIAKAAMSDEEKTYHDALKTDDEKAGFRKMSKADRAAAIAKRDELPAHIKKQLADADELRKRVADLEARDELVTLSKRAAEHDLPESEGETIQKAYRGDRPAVDKLLGFIKSANAAAKAAGVFKEFGSTRTDDAKTSAYDQLQAKAADLRKADPALSREKAFTKVYEDPANADLVKRERSENRPSAA